MAGERQRGKPEGRAVKTIEEGDLIDLWKYFQDRADTLKERQWTIGTWIVTLLSGVAAFSLNQETLSITRTGVAIGKPLPALAIGVVGILICGYAWIVIRNYGLHIQRNWDRADRVKKQISDLDVFWKGENVDCQPSRHGLPQESIYLRVIVVGFLILFAGISFVSIVAALGS
jgi:hypothetical protein